MKKYFYTLIILCAAVFVYGQGTITGKVVDESDNIALIGAIIDIDGTTDGTITDFEGDFTLENIDNGTYTLVFSYLGYATKEMEVTVSDNLVDLGVVNMTSDAIGISEVNVIASIAKDRKTPVAVSTIKGSEIEAKLGNQEYPEILRSTPSIYVTKQGGGFGDARINVRGFDQRNTAVMINGVPINDMENGWVYWSNWAGLSDVTSSMQVQRGLGASKLAVPSVGGSINIITDAASFDRGGTATIGIGNDGYHKVGLTLHTGMSENGWALSVSGSRTAGSMYAHGTEFEGYSYFASVSKTFNDRHTLQLTGFGAPQYHHQRQYGRYDGVNYAFIDNLKENEDWGDEAYRYNPQWGYYKGEEFTWRKNFYHKPIAYLNHYFTINDKLDLKTSAYASFGRGGGTGDLGRINGSFRTSGKFKSLDSGVKFDEIAAWNSGVNVPEFGDDNTVWNGPSGDGANTGGYAGSYVGQKKSNGFIRRASMNEHNWFGLISNLTADINNNLTFVGGVDGRYYKGLHYRRLENLLGLSAYYDKADINNPHHYVATEGREDGNEIDYYNNGFVSWIGIYGQLEYTSGNVTTFISASGSNQGFRREDLFNYSGDEQLSDWVNHQGGNVKAGINYNINDNHNVFANAGYFSKQPIFDNVFVNYRNDINDDASNQGVVSAELGYGYRSQPLRANLNLYYTNWNNRQESFSDDIEIGGQLYEDANFNFSDISQTHMGIELDVTAPILDWLELTGMISVNNWEYTSNFEGFITDDAGNEISETTLYADGVKVPDAAQTTGSLGVILKPIRNLTIDLEGYYADRLFSNFSIADNDFLQEGGEAWELPAYGLLDGGISYKFNLGSGNSFTLRANVNNILDNHYIAESESNILTNESSEIIPDTDNASIYNTVYFGFGRTWNISARFNF